MSAIQEAIDYFLKTGMHTRVDALRREQQKADAAQRTLTSMGYYWDGGEFYHPPKPDMLQPQQSSRIIPVTLISGDDDCALIN